METETAETGPDDEFPDEPETGPNRRCVATGQVLPKERLIRFVVDPSGTLVPDLAEKLPGRGVWVIAERAALDKAVAKNAFARGLKRQVRLPEGLVAAIEAQLLRQSLDLLGLARRAGELVAGFDKVDGALRAGPVGLLVEAADGSLDQRKKLRALSGGAPVLSAFTAAELAAALGREGVVVHAVVRSGRLAERIGAAATRLAGLRPNDREQETSGTERS